MTNNQQILKANELPAGARMMSRTGRALTGSELATGAAALIGSICGPEVEAAALVTARGQNWAGIHLTYPKARVEWVSCEGGVWLRLCLATNMNWEYHWNDEEADIRNMKSIGPFASPDDFREALGLARTAQFKLPGGEVVTAELPDAVLRPVEFDSAQIKVEAAKVAELPEEGDKVISAEQIRDDVLLAEAGVVIAESELLAEPPTVVPEEPVKMAVKPVGAALKAGRGKKK